MADLKRKKRTKLSERVLPEYSRGEEIFNMVSHIIGGAIGIAAIVLCSIFAHSGYGVVSGVIFGVTMLALYTMSSIYHGLKPDTMAKRVFQIIDHCSIFILIAGTYTPIVLCTIREYNTAVGWTIFGIIWGLAAIGVTLNSIDLKKYKVFSMICYLVMGWLIITRISLIIRLLGTPAFWMLFVRRCGVYSRSGILWCGKKQKMDAFRISYFLCNRKRSALFNDTFLCYLIIQL